MKKETTEEIAKIKRSNKRYCIKASVCKLQALRHEIFEEWEDAIECMKLAVHYEKLIKVRHPNYDPQELEIKGLGKFIKKMQKKLSK